MASNRTQANITQQVLKKIKPTKNENVENKNALKLIVQKLKKVINHDVKIELVGSFAKNTHVKSKREFDLFLLFPKKYSKPDISKLTFNWAKKIFNKTKIAYAEHPYVQIQYNKFDIDLVPAYLITNIKDKATSVDRSPMHTKYINSKLTSKQKDDVRILKQFLKGLDLYGAELRVEGFSGYLTELLIVKYKTFKNLLEHATKWEIPLIIDLENYKTCKKFEKPEDPMIVIDPVDENRNVAAVISNTSMARFIFYSRQFLKKPKMDYFFPRKPKINKKQLAKLVQDRKTKIKIYEFSAPKVVEDILWPQLKKTTYSILRTLKNKEYRILGFYYWANYQKCIIMFELYEDQLPGIIEQQGPGIVREKNVDTFIQKHKNAVDMQIVHDKIITIKKRKNIKFEDDLKEIIKDDCVAIPVRFRKLLTKRKVITIKQLIDKYPNIAHTYFTRTIKP